MKELILPVLWLLIALSIPIIFLVIGYSNYARGMEVWEILLRQTVAFIGYVVITYVGFWANFLFTFGAGGAHAKPGVERSAMLHFIFILIYACAAWLLCSLVKGNLIKPWKRPD